MFKKLKFVLAASAVATLAACGGGGSGGTPAAPVANAVIEGVWSGTASNGNALRTVVLDNGSTYVMFGTAVGATLFVSGFDQGTVTASGNSISGTGFEYGVAGVGVAGSVTGTAVSGVSISGTTSYGATSTTFNLTPIPVTTYDYNAAATNAAVVGTWTGNMLNGTAATLTMSAGGAVAGTNLGCTFTGTALPRASGKNVFDVSVTFGAAPCALPGQTATGIAITYAVAGTAQKQLLVAVQSSTKANGTMFIATR